VLQPAGFVPKTAERRKTPAVAVRDEGSRLAMTGAKVRSDHANDKALNVKLS
jgi:hypothetical protein